MIGLTPVLVLTLLVGLLQLSLSLLLRGGMRTHLVLLPFALAGAVAGAVAGLRAPDLLRIGDLPVAWTSVGAWAGIVLGSLLVVLVGRRRAARG